MTKAQTVQHEKAEAIKQLREWIKPGDTVYTILDHVSSSGMSRAIRVVLPYTRDDGTIDHIHPNWAIGKALGLRHWKRHGREQDALVVGGAGMDMGFHLVYELSFVLYGARLTRDIYKASATHDKPNGQLLTRAGAPEGQVWIGGYWCLGKGKCPSNYHVNHRERLRCEGTREHNENGPDFGAFCWKPSRWNGDAIPENWPMIRHDIGDGAYIDIPAACITQDREHNEISPTICPTCHGAGDVPNPEGPERFDILHSDGYALRHRWL